MASTARRSARRTQVRGDPVGVGALQPDAFRRERLAQLTQDPAQVADRGSRRRHTGALHHIAAERLLNAPYPLSSSTSSGRMRR